MSDICDRCDRHVWFGENSRAQAALGRVRELANEWEAAAASAGPRNYAGGLFAATAKELRVALDDAR